MKITTTYSQNLKVKPDFNNLGFGKFFSDHMFVANYNAKNEWHNPRVIPYGPLGIDPASTVLHYGQALFEGMKAFKQQNGNIALFRPEFNWKRLTDGAERLCMKSPPKDLFLEGIKTVINVDKDWIPSAKNASLYIRPTLIGTEGFLGVRPAEEYIFYVILSPVGSYYVEGTAPVKIWVEKDFLRAAPGGLGATKAAANYAGSLKAASMAKKKGFSQVLWLDIQREYVEEVGTMNVFFVFKNEIVTPSLDGTILGGAVRDSAIALLKSWGKNVVERKIKISEVLAASQNGNLLEMFGTGTAAVISPVGELTSNDWSIQINQNQTGPVATKLFETLTSIQYGLADDPFSWITAL